MLPAITFLARLRPAKPAKIKRQFQNQMTISKSKDNIELIEQSSRCAISARSVSSAQGGFFIDNVKVSEATPHDVEVVTSLRGQQQALEPATIYFFGELLD